eukprot:CAMPEP_0118873990 /NCGR_PEP_ID=MMETSP1163-20130328/15596_1 /TAXON_ID=124430 /ORGANISM="Phaeomonas parva, Strain CCMP2877" /LENGTH=649 /DNA_ID=CAMNT_0006809319 /DNA_START=55 /DNA_END=2004 /DNA_ORIENTATION=-
MPATRGNRRRRATLCAESLADRKARLLGYSKANPSPDPNPNPNPYPKPQPDIAEEAEASLQPTPKDNLKPKAKARAPLRPLQPNRGPDGKKRASPEAAGGAGAKKRRRSVRLRAGGKPNAKAGGGLQERVHELEWNQAALVARQAEIFSKKQAAASELRRMTAENASLAAQLAEAVERIEALTTAAAAQPELQHRVAELEAELAGAREEAAAENVTLREQVAALQETRRTQHNLIQELRGNVRVFARVRPGETACVRVGADGETVTLKKAPGGRGESTCRFALDGAFSPGATQDDVFAHVKDFVQSALDGYSVCLFSYGQTGSGKTHTMVGTPSGPERGILPRALEHVGEHIAELEALGWTFELEATFVEIHNEVIKDLLANLDGGDGNGGGDAGNGNCDIRRDPRTNEIHLTNVRQVPITDVRSKAEVGAIYRCAARARTTKATTLNDTSSRSHAIFTLNVAATNAAQGRWTNPNPNPIPNPNPNASPNPIPNANSKPNSQFELQPLTVRALRGALSLVDLAGSERIAKSNVTGATLRESLQINKSLSCLSDVFAALSAKASHVPYRNSKLTTLLQPALSGAGKTMMLVNLRPEAAHEAESLCTLRFAEKVNGVELGRAQQQQLLPQAQQQGQTKRRSARLRRRQSVV